MDQKTLLKRLAVCAVGVTVLLACVMLGTVEGAGDLPVLAAQEGQGQGGVTVRSTRTFYLEIGLVALLCAGALFAVCRSSNRG